MNSRHKELFEEIKEKFSHMGEDTTSANSRVLLVDGLNTFIRVFAAVPVCNENGVHIGGISGFLRSIGYAIRITRPTRVIVVFDGKGGSVRRRKLYPEYKSHRAPQLRLNRSDIFQNEEEEQKMMTHELLRVIQYIDQLPIVMLAIDNVEADDVIAYIATHVLPESKVTIMSADKDFLQLVNERIEIWSPTKKKIYTPELVKTEFGVPPENLALFRAIGSSDKSDNIKGVDGFGAKTIMKKVPILCERIVTIEEMFLDVAQRAVETKDKMLERLHNNKSVVERNVALMQLSDADISASAKMKVVEKIHSPIRPLNKIKLLQMVIEDKLEAGIPNMHVWLREHFGQLELFAHMTQKKVTNDNEHATG